MREVYAGELGDAAPPDEPVFYTITEADVGTGDVLSTTAGPIPVGPIMGVIVAGDVGRRMHRIVDGSGRWRWRPEDDAGMTRRLITERAERWLT